MFKVETIGDAYMVVAGHDGDRNHAQHMVDMAVDMLRVVEDLQGKVGPAAEASSSTWNRGTDHSLPLPAVMHDGVLVDLEEAACPTEKQAEWKLQIRIGLHTGAASGAGLLPAKGACCQPLGWLAAGLASRLALASPCWLPDCQHRVLPCSA